MKRQKRFFILTRAERLHLKRAELAQRWAAGELVQEFSSDKAQKGERLNE